MSSVREVYTSIEEIRSQDYLLASYYLELGPGSDVLDKAVGFAVGQTLGTWVEVPGVTDEMRARHRGKLVKVLPLPPVDLSTQAPDTQAYLFQIALPTINFGADFPQLLTTILGNDASTSVQAKLVDLELPDSYTAQFPGPQFGIAGLRELTEVTDRPLLLNMIKPCTGLTPTDAASIFYDTAMGGIDFIKDDELLGSPSFSPVQKRVELFGQAAAAAAEHTGVQTIYIPNVTTRPDKVLDTARSVVDAGAQAIMISFAAVGYGLLQALAETVKVPILGHYATAGMFYEGPRSGLSSTLALGLLPRLAGADLVMLNTPYGPDAECAPAEPASGDADHGWWGAPGDGAHLRLRTRPRPDAGRRWCGAGAPRRRRRRGSGATPSRRRRSGRGGRASGGRGAPRARGGAAALGRAPTLTALTLSVSTDSPVFVRDLDPDCAASTAIRTLIEATLR
jgi:2,3-diketo-5-methylthiopentyl-1-phosphate enolase